MFVLSISLSTAWEISW